MVCLKEIKEDGRVPQLRSARQTTEEHQDDVQDKWFSRSRNMEARGNHKDA